MLYVQVMPTIKVEKQSPLNPAESFKRISNLLSNDPALRKLDAKYSCEFNEQDLTGTAGGSMFKAKMAIHPDAVGSKVEITVDLPFHLSLVKSMVESTLKKKLEEALA